MRLFKHSLLFTSVVLASCGTYQKVDITTSMFPHYDLVRALTKDTSISTSLIVPPGVEIHSYTPTAQQIRQIHDSTVLFYTSDSIETWVNNLTINQTELVNIHKTLFHDDALHGEDDHDHDHEEENHEEHQHGVHYWTSPENILLELLLIEQKLESLFPEQAVNINNNASEYYESIESLSSDFLDYLSTIENKEVFFVGHNAMADFGDYFGIKITSLVDDIKPDADPTAKDLTTLTNAIIDSDVEVIFVEELVAPTFANTLVNELKTKHNRDLLVYELHGYHNVSINDFENDTTYFDLLSRNINYLKEALS